MSKQRGKNLSGGRFRRTHGLSGSRIYKIWVGIIERCTLPKHNSWRLYGGRGIRVCERWRDFTAFYADMGATYLDGLTIDRIDSDGHYEPGNCRWASHSAQQRNRRNNVRVTINGETKCLIEWAEQFGIRDGMITNRLARGWPIERAITEPAKDRSNKSGFAGVSRGRGVYRANIKRNGKTVYIGSYATLEAAHAAFLKAKAELAPGRNEGRAEQEGKE